MRSSVSAFPGRRARGSRGILTLVLVFFLFFVFFLVSVAAPAVGARAVLQAQGLAAPDSTPVPLGPTLGLAPFEAAPGAEYSTYLTPTMCVMASLREETRATRTIPAKLAQMVPHPDTLALASAAVHAAQQCGARFTVASTDTFELPGLFRVALLANQDDQAAAAGARWVQEIPPSDTAGQAERLLRLFQLEADTRPRTSARRQALQRDFDGLRALGPGAVEEQLLAQEWMRDQAGVDGDLPGVVAEAETLHTLWHSLPSVTQRNRFAEIGMEISASPQDIFFDLPTGQLSSPTVRPAVERMLARFQDDCRLQTRWPELCHAIPRTYDSLVYQKDRVGSFAWNENVHPARPLVAPYWFQRPDTTTTYPRPGVPTVVLQVDTPCGSYCWNAYAAYAAYRRLYAEFAPRGVDFILITHTAHQFWPGTLLPVATDVDSLRAYFLDQRKLPGILGIEETQFDAEGRPLASKNDLPGVNQVYLVTRDGLSWPIGDDLGTWATEAKVRAFIALQLLPSIPSSTP